MKAALFYLTYSLLWILTLLPLPVLYALSGFLYLVLYYIAGYRKDVVTRNLKNSFPDMGEDEIKRLARKSFRQLMDYFLEWMYRIHMGNRELERRMHFKNPEILQDYCEQGKSIMLLLSHQGNWEWPTRISLYSGHTVLAIYKPLKNKYFDRLFLKLRGKFGILGVRMDSTLRTLVKYKEQGEPVVVLNLADQRPQYGSLQHWTRFLNQDTPVITGAEKIIRRFGMVTIFLSISKIKRGYYEAEFRLLNEDPSEAGEYEITRRYLDCLEELIRRQPELYLWTHKRWHYKRSDTRKEIIDI